MQLKKGEVCFDLQFEGQSVVAGKVKAGSILYLQNVFNFILFYFVFASETDELVHSSPSFYSVKDLWPWNGVAHI